MVVSIDGNSTAKKGNTMTDDVKSPLSTHGEVDEQLLIDIGQTGMYETRPQSESDEEHALALALEEELCQRVMRAHEAYLNAHFHHRDINFGWSSDTRGFMSKVYGDGTQPLVYVLSCLADDNKTIWHSVTGFACAWFQRKDEATAVSDTDTASVSQVPRLEDDFHTHHTYNVFFHQFGLAARCRQRGTTVVFDICEFSVTEFPSGTMMYIIGSDSAEDAGVLLRIWYDASGSYQIVVSDDITPRSNEMHTRGTSLFLPLLSEIAANLLQSNM
jgi:hypothetical protein